MNHIEMPGTHSPMDSAAVLIVDDDLHQLESLSRGISLFGHTCITLTSIADAVSFVRGRTGENIHVVIADLSCQFNQRVDLIRKLKAVRPRVQVIAICGLERREEYNQMREEGITILRRPFSPNELNRVIQNIRLHLA